MVTLPGLTPFTRAIPMTIYDTDPPDTGWFDVTVEGPTLFYPYRNDDLTGTSALESIRINYYPDEPLLTLPEWPPDENGGGFEGYPAQERGSGILSQKGRWWIRVEHSRAGLLNKLMPMAFIPYPNPSVLQNFTRARPMGHPVVKQVFAVGAGAAVQLVSVQELLDGVTAVEVYPSVFSAATVFYWGRASLPGFFGIANERYRFEGKNLPLADLWVARTALPSANFSVVLYH